MQHEFQGSETLHGNALGRQVGGDSGAFVRLGQQRLDLFQARALAIRIKQDALEPVAFDDRPDSDDLDH
ncbi:hypothetical protein D3C86_2143860 [compost metagenome]